MHLSDGDLVADRYRVGRLLGRGGMAEVHVAHDELLGRDVALKVLARHLLDDPASVGRLRREGSTVAALNHPNVVTLYDVLTDRDEQVLVMELVQGPSLADRLRDEGPLSVAEALAIGRDVAAGLAAAHDRGLVHRDVKPSNVLLADGRAKVADFGIARAVVDELGATTAALGTLDYVAPEQARGSSPDPRGDLYALGCVLVEALTGTPPFTRDTPAAVLAGHLHDPPPVPSASVPAVPTEVDDLVASLLAKDPDARPASAHELLTALDRVEVVARDGPTTPVAAAPAPAAGAGPPATSRLGDGPDGPSASGGPDDETRRHQDAAGEPPTAPPPAGPTTPVVGAPDDRVTGRRTGRRAAVLAAVALVLGLVVLAVALGRDTGQEPATPTVGDAPTSPSAGEEATGSDPDQPTPSAADGVSDQPDEAAPTSPAEAVAALRSTLAEGRSSGLVSEKGLEEIEKHLAELVEKTAEAAEDDDPDKREAEAGKRIGELAERIDEQRSKGELDDRLAERLRADLELVAAAYDVEVVTDDGGPGRGRGNGNGNDGDDDDDDDD